MTMQALAPITLFCYNRPEHLRRTVEALQKNELASESELIIYSDGPKTDADAAKVNAVREYIRTISGFKSVKINASPANKGLASSVIDGVTEVVNQYGRIIVLEDDVLTSKYFLKFMNDALNTYENCTEVLAIGSWNYFAHPQKIKSDFFLRLPDSIGWATYQRSWVLFEGNSQFLLDQLQKRNLIDKFNMDKSYRYDEMLKYQITGKIDSWAIRWTATAILNDKLTYYPQYSMTKHIGFDAAATHCKDDYDLNRDLELATCTLNQIRQSIVENPLAVKYWKKFWGKFNKTDYKNNIKNWTIAFLCQFIPTKVKNLLKWLLISSFRNNYREQIKLKNLPMFLPSTTVVDMNQYAVTIPDFPQKSELNRRAEKELALFFQYPVNPSKRGKIKSIFQLPGRVCRMLTDFILSSFNDLRMRCRCLLIKTLLALSNRRGKCIKLAGYKIRYTNSLSLYMEYKDIFINRIYHFQTDNRHPYIIDGGGCIGVSVLYFKRIYPESQIIVFEPDSEISSILRFNLENNNIQDVTVIESGLSETDGECSFLPDGVDGGKIAPASTKGLDVSQLKTIKLEKLSKYITQPVDFLKLNIEGQELAVLAELEQHKKLRLIEKMVIEYHGWTEEKQKLGDILNLLERNGFRYMLHDFDSETNSSSKPPFSPLPERTWFCLIAAAGKK